MFGQPPKEPTPEKRPRSFRWVNRSGRSTIVEADKVQFTTNHVVFWRNNPDGEPFLVSATESGIITHIEESEDLL